MPSLVKTCAGLALGLVGTSICIVEGLRLRSVTIPISQFGFANYLPMLFWIGFSFLLIGAFLITRSNNDICYLIVLFMIAAVMFNMPFFAEEMPRDFDGYWHMSSANWVSQQGFIFFPSIKIYTRLAYLQYPALFVDTAGMKLVTGLDKLTILRWYPIFITAIFVLNFYVLAKKLLASKDKAFIATLFALAANGAMFSNHFSSSATAQAFFPLLIYTFVKVEEGTLKKIEYLVTLVLLNFFMVTLHPIMPLLFLGLILSLLIFSRVTSSVKHIADHSLLLALLFFFMVAYFSWGVFVANWGLTALSTDLAYFLRLENPVLATTILQRQVLVYPFVGWIKRAGFLAFVVPAFAITLVSFLKKTINKIHVIFVVFTFLWFLSSLVTDLSDRLLVWVIPFAVLVLATANFNVFSKLTHRPHLRHVRLIETGLLLALLLVPSITFATFYSDEAEYGMTKAEYRGFEYVVSLNRNVGFTFGHADYALYFFNDSGTDYVSASNLTDATVIYYYSTLYEWYYWHEGSSLNTFTISLNESLHDPTLNLVYSNDNFTIFRRNGGG